MVIRVLELSIVRCDYLSKSCATSAHFATSSPRRHVSHLYFHTSADRRHHCRRPTTITPQPRQMTTITNSPSWTIEGGDNHRQLIGTTSKCFLLSVSCFILLTIYFSADSHCPICTVHIFFFPFFRFTNYLPSRSFGLPCLRFARP